MKKQKWWLWIGCFLTGYNYEIVTDCGQASINKVKRYSSAMLIIIVVWSFVGYCFTERYLHLHRGWPWIGALLMGFIIVQIERIIIYIKNSKLGSALRFVLAILMAIIGSTILDQIVFKSDIERVADKDVDKKVNERLPERTKQLNDQIREYNKEREQIRKEKLTIKLQSSTKRKDSTGTRTEVTERTEFNPRTEQNKERDRELREKIEKLITKKNNIENDLRKDIKLNTGLLDELGYFWEVISPTKSIIAFIFSLVYFFLFLTIELLVLINVWIDNKDKDEDGYNETINHQKRIRIQRLKNLGGQ